MKTPNLFLILTLAITPLYAHAEDHCVSSDDAFLAGGGGDKGGNAGSGNEILFRSLAKELLGWVGRTHLKEIDTGKFDREEVEKTLLTQKWRVCFNDDEYINVRGRKRSCRNSFDPAQPELIECSNKAFGEEAPVSRWMTVFHELLGVGQYETNDGAESDTSISSQLLKFLYEEKSFKLSDLALPQSNEIKHVHCGIMNGFEGKLGSHVSIIDVDFLENGVALYRRAEGKRAEPIAEQMSEEPKREERILQKFILGYEMKESLDRRLAWRWDEQDVRGPVTDLHFIKTKVMDGKNPIEMTLIMPPENRKNLSANSYVEASGALQLWSANGTYTLECEWESIDRDALPALPSELIRIFKDPKWTK